MKNSTLNTPFRHKNTAETIYFLQKTDLIKGAKVMASAFHDDPAIRYLLGGKTEGKDDWRYFLALLKSVFRKCLILSSTESVTDLLVLFPPRVKTIPSLRFMLSGGFSLLRYFGLDMFFRSMTYESNCLRIKENFLTPKTWYCMCFVVSPEKQGQGNGTRLIKPVLEAFNDLLCPLYLETHKEINTHIYEHFGFDVVDVSSIPKTDTTQWAMLHAPDYSSVKYKQPS